MMLSSYSWKGMFLLLLLFSSDVGEFEQNKVGTVTDVAFDVTTGCKG